MQQIISNEDIKVIEVNGVQVVSSREIANNFGKYHDKVKRSIKSLISNSKEILPKMAISYDKNISDKVKNMFLQSTYIDVINREQDEYLVTKDGFSLLAMGFTGKKALTWKLKYIDTFNKMEEIIKTDLEQQI